MQQVLHKSITIKARKNLLPQLFYEEVHFQNITILYRCLENINISKAKVHRERDVITSCIGGCSSMAAGVTRNYS